MSSELVAFRLYADVKMNRAVDKTKDYISPGGYEMVMNGKSVQFDFEESATNVDEDDPTIIHIMHKNPDYDEYEELNDITAEDLRNVTAIPEFFVYTGEPGESDLCPVRLIACAFVLPYDDWEQINISGDVCEQAVMGSY